MKLQGGAVMWELPLKKYPLWHVQQRPGTRCINDGWVRKHKVIVQYVIKEFIKGIVQ